MIPCRNNKRRAEKWNTYISRLQMTFITDVIDLYQIYLSTYMYQRILLNLTKSRIAIHLTHTRSIRRIQIKVLTTLSFFTARKRSLRRLYFYTYLSFYPQRGLPQCMLGYHPPDQATPPPGTRHPPGPGTPGTSPPPRKQNDRQV